MKIAPLWHALARAGERFEVAVVHTGQHYDDEMSDVFLRQFNLPRPHYALGAGGGSHAEQTAAVMTAYERVCMTDPPDWVIVVGDVNSTMAATLAAKKLQLSVAHLEAGLRSFDRTMPEEINRVVTDALADLLWTPSPDGDANLLREGIPPARIDRVGNIMIDAFELLRDEIAASQWPARHGLAGREFAVVTLHRPSNVDDPERLAVLVGVPPRDAELALPMSIFWNERRGIRTCWYGNCLGSRDFQLLADWYRNGSLYLDEMVSRRIQLDEVENAFAVMTKGEELRSVIVFE